MTLAFHFNLITIDLFPLWMTTMLFPIDSGIVLWSCLGICHSMKLSLLVSVPDSVVFLCTGNCKFVKFSNLVQGITQHFLQKNFRVDAIAQKVEELAEASLMMQTSSSNANQASNQAKLPPVCNSYAFLLGCIFTKYELKSDPRISQAIIHKSPQITDTDKYHGLEIVIFASNLKVIIALCCTSVPNKRTDRRMDGQTNRHNRFYYLPALQLINMGPYLCLKRNWNLVPSHNGSWQSWKCWKMGPMLLPWLLI